MGVERSWAVGMKSVFCEKESNNEVGNMGGLSQERIYANCSAILVEPPPPVVLLWQYDKILYI